MQSFTHTLTDSCLSLLPLEFYSTILPTILPTMQLVAKELGRGHGGSEELIAVRLQEQRQRRARWPSHRQVRTPWGAW